MIINDHHNVLVLFDIVPWCGRNLKSQSNPTRGKRKKLKKSNSSNFVWSRKRSYFAWVLRLFSFEIRYHCIDVWHNKGVHTAVHAHTQIPLTLVAHRFRWAETHVRSVGHYRSGVVWKSVFVRRRLSVISVQRVFSLRTRCNLPTVIFSPRVIRVFVISYLPLPTIHRLHNGKKYVSGTTSVTVPVELHPVKIISRKHPVNLWLINER